MRLGTWFVALGLCGLTLAACEDDPRVPYIPPKLANWPQPYRGVNGLGVHVFNTGWLHVPEAFILRGGSLTRARDLPAPAVVIEHPTHGLILFNTGLNPAGDASPWGSGWTSLLDVSVSRNRGLQAQMREAGLSPEAVRWIVVSDLRFDHAGEIEAFPQARVVVTKTEHEAARQASSGYVPSEFDDVANWEFIDFTAATPVATFEAHVDLFGDGSCLLVDASGVTLGALAMLVRLPQHPLLLAGSLASVEESVRYAAKPASAAEPRRWWDHIWRLKKFRDLVPELVVLPGRALQPVPAVRSKAILIHESEPAPTDGPPTPTPNVLQRFIPKPM